MMLRNDYHAFEIYIRSVSDLTDAIDECLKRFNSFSDVYFMASRPKTTVPEMAQATIIRNNLMRLKNEIEENPVVIEVMG